MKVPDSGMPAEQYWDSLFDIPTILDWLALVSCDGPVVEIGCGYGTFTLPLARTTTQTIHAYDIDPAMIQCVNAKLQSSGITNVVTKPRDVIQTGTGLTADSVALVLLFNILHSEHNHVLLAEAARVLKPHGRLAVLHWRNDQPTPRGPAISSRPVHRELLSATSQLALEVAQPARLIKPYHWAVQFRKLNRRL